MPLSISRKRQWLSFVFLVGIIALMTACASQRIAQPDWCPVPEQTARLEYDLHADSDGKQRVLAKALDDAVCLVLSGKAKDCQDPDVEPPVCDLRSKEEVRGLLKPAFGAIASLKLESAYSINDAISDQIPGAIPTRRVRDARREYDCIVWTRGEKPCVAFKYDILWFILESSNQDPDVDRIEIFLAEPACSKDIR